MSLHPVFRYLIPRTTFIIKYLEVTHMINKSCDVLYVYNR
jgi:hypothetical protein